MKKIIKRLGNFTLTVFAFMGLYSCSVYGPDASGFPDGIYSERPAPREQTDDEFSDFDSDRFNYSRQYSSSHYDELRLGKKYLKYGLYKEDSKQLGLYRESSLDKDNYYSLNSRPVYNFSFSWGWPYGFYDPFFNPYYGNPYYGNPFYASTFYRPWHYDSFYYRPYTSYYPYYHHPYRYNPYYYNNYYGWPIYPVVVPFYNNRTYVGERKMSGRDVRYQNTSQDYGKDYKNRQTHDNQNNDYRYNNHQNNDWRRQHQSQPNQNRESNNVNRDGKARDYQLGEIKWNR